MAGELQSTPIPGLNWQASLPGGINSWSAGGGLGTSGAGGFNLSSLFDSGEATGTSSPISPADAGFSSSPSLLGAPGVTGGAGGAARAIAGFGPLIGALLGGNNQSAAAAGTNTAQLTQLATSLFGTGTALTGDATSALNPVLQYLKAVAGGDPGAVMGATQPQRARVIDQYDTAKRTAQFAPRGGGQASASENASTSEASTLSNVTASARTAGVQQLGQLGTSLASAGISADASGLSALNASIQDYEQQAQRTDQQNSQLGSSIGLAVASALPYLLAL